MGARFVTANGIRFAYLDAGPPDGPLALCLHGFPDHARTWRFLLPALAQAGFHAVAPWLRGYAPTAIPADGDVRLDTLAADANALHQALGGDERAILVGHDWGAIAAHRAAAAEAHRWARLVTIAVPPEPQLLRLQPTLTQARRSRYIGRFQFPGAVSWLEADGYGNIDALWGQWSPGYRLPRSEREVLLATLRSPGTLATAVAYYRQLRDDALRGRFPRADVVPPQRHLYLHGLADGCLGPEVFDGLQLPNAGSRVVRVPGAGHFLHLEHPDAVNRWVVDFVASVDEA